MQRLRALIPALLILLGLLTVSLPSRAENGGTTPGQTIGNPQDKQLVNFTAALAAVDTNINTLLTDSPEFRINGRQNVTVLALFSQDQTQTCKVRVIYYNKDSNGVIFDCNISREKTISAINDSPADRFKRSDNNLYRSETETFDSFGAWYCRVMLTTKPAVGTVTLRVGSY